MASLGLTAILLPIVFIIFVVAPLAVLLYLLFRGKKK